MIDPDAQGGAAWHGDVEDGKKKARNRKVCIDCGKDIIECMDLHVWGGRCPECHEKWRESHAEILDGRVTIGTDTGLDRIIDAVDSPPCPRCLRYADGIKEARRLLKSALEKLDAAR